MDERYSENRGQPDHDSHRSGKYGTKERRQYRYRVENDDGTVLLHTNREYPSVVKPIITYGMT